MIHSVPAQNTETGYTFNSDLYSNIVNYFICFNYASTDYKSALAGTSTDWNQVSSGSYFSVAIKNDGTLWSWGENNHGDLGNGLANDNVIPTQLCTSNNWKQVSAYEWHSTALKEDGTLWTWGENENGQLGNGTVIDSNVPIQVGSSTDWVQTDAGYSTTMAIKSDSTLWAWGSNFGGELGNGTTTENHIPIQIGTSISWKQISAGNATNVALNFGDSLYDWGLNYYGELGNGTTIISLIPVYLPCLINVEIEEYVMDIKSIVYPNPVSEILSIQVPEKQNIEKAIIRDIVGKKIIEQNGKNCKINVRNLENGIYIIQIYFKNKDLFYKFIKKN